MAVSEARASLSDVLARVEAGEEVTLTRHGRPVAVVVRPDVLRSRRATKVLADAERIGEMLVTARTRPLSPAAMDVSWAERLVAEIRADREARD